jgi:hypothetical protein
MTPEALDHIIAAVGKEPADRAKLATHLNQVQSIIRQVRGTKRHTLKSIRKAFEEVAVMVETNPAARSLAPEIAAILDKARHLEAESKGRQLSLTDYLCGVVLPYIFEEQFGRATTARNGKYVKFANAALGARPETIIRSMTAAKWAKNYPEFVRARRVAKQLTKDSPILKAMLKASVQVGKN